MALKDYKNILDSATKIQPTPKRKLIPRNQQSVFELAEPNVSASIQKAPQNKGMVTREAGYNKLGKKITQPTKVNQPKALNQLTNPDAKLYEKSNNRRDTELGKMSVNSETLLDGRRKDTYSIGGNTMSRYLSPEEASSGERKRFKLGDTSNQNQIGGRKQSFREIPKNIRSDGTYTLKSGLSVNFDDNVPQDRRQAFMQAGSGLGNRKRADYRTVVGREIANNQPRSLESLSMSPKNKRKLDIEEARYNQANQTNIRANEIDAERNRILEDNNIRNDERLRLPQASNPVQNDVRVIKGVDANGNAIETIMRDDGSGTYMDAMGKRQSQGQPLPKGHPDLAILRANLNNPIRLKQFQALHHYLPEWAM